VSSRPSLLALPLLLLASCKDTPVDPADVPVSIVAIAGIAQAGSIGSAVATTPTFEIRNADGDAISGLSFTVTVISGGGAVTGKPSATSAGPTSIGTWTLGTVPGTQTLRVSRGSLTPVEFTATAAPMAISSGNNQTALAGAALANPVRARVVDGSGNAAVGASVTWDIVAGGGSLTGSTTTFADASGIATAPAWTLGKDGGTQQLRATFGAVEAIATANIQSTLVVELRWVGTVPTGATLAAFTRAVDRIRATIVGGVNPVGMPGAPNALTNIQQCDAGFASTSIPQQNIPGVIIYATIIPIDGAGAILGQAGPCLSRSFDMYKTALGTMRFDSADIATLVGDGRIDAVILHEMLHVMGIGTSWELNNLLLNPTTADTRFLGGAARTACANVNGGTTTCATNVPVHSTDGPGSRDAHWRESTFTNELMTPFIVVGGTNPMSAMTIQSLADLGYTVNANPQDAFTLASITTAVRAGGGTGASGGQAALRLPAPSTPVFLVDRTGRGTRLRAVR
jgi:hypothetical protein